MAKISPKDGRFGLLSQAPGESPPSGGRVLPLPPCTSLPAWNRHSYGITKREKRMEKRMEKG